MANNNAERHDKRRTLMLETPIPRLIPKMAVPTILAMLTTSIYSLADAFYVSHLGTSATAAVGINSSLDYLIMMAGSFLAMGASSYIARLLGARKDEQASSVLSTAFFTAIFLGLLVAVFGLTFSEQLVRLLGATDSSAVYSIQYANYILYAAPFMAANFVMNQCLRSEGSATYSMFGMMFGAILNIAIAPLFIFTFNWGVSGAGAACAISKFVSFCLLISPYIRRKSLLTLSPKLIRYSADTCSEVAKMGSPSLIRLGLNVISNIITNNLAGLFSDSALAAISVCNRVMMFMASAIMGFAAGLQPVAGFNWGAKRYDRVREGFRFSLIVGVACLATMSAVMFVFAKDILLLFTEADAQLVAIGVFCLRAQCLAVPMQGYAIVTNMLYSGIGKASGSLILSTARQGTCLIPMLLILPHLFGLEGLSSSQAAADALSLLIAVPLSLSAFRQLKKLMKSQKDAPAPAYEKAMEPSGLPVEEVI